MNKSSSTITTTTMDTSTTTEQHVGTTSWVGNALGGVISRIMLKSMSKSGQRCPLEIDLSEIIQSTLDAAMGIPRPIDVIKADIARLEKELEEATKASQEQTEQQQLQQQAQELALSTNDKQSVNSKNNAWSLF